MRVNLLHGLLVLALAMAPGLGKADSQTPTDLVETLNGGLLQVMRNADELGFQGRYETLEPILDQVFDLAAMARFSVGRDQWQALSADQQQGLVAAFTDLSVANYAANFDGWSGESFEIVEARDAPRGTRVVLTRLNRPEGEPVALNYVTRQQDGDWRILDVLLDGTISEMSRRRDEFRTVITSEGYDALIARITQAATAARDGG